MRIVRGKQLKPRRVLLYGQEGVGKSTWAAGAPAPYFIDCEGGVGDLDVVSSGRLNSWEEIRQVWSDLMNEPHDFKSVVIDTVDWMEHLIHAEVCSKSKVDSIEKAAGGYGKGYVEAASTLQRFLSRLEELMAKRQMNIVILGHCSPVKVNNPESEQYDQWAPDVHKAAASILREWCDEVLFASFRTFVRTADNSGKPNQKRYLGIGDDERYIRTTRSAAVQAKNRLNLPAELPMKWSEYAKYWPSSGSAAVVGGSDNVKTGEGSNE